MDNAGELPKPTTSKPIVPRRAILRAIGLGSSLLIAKKIEDTVNIKLPQASSTSVSGQPQVGAEGKPEEKKAIASSIVYSNLENPIDIDLAHLQVEKQKVKAKEYFKNPNHPHIANTLLWKGLVSKVCKEAKLSPYLQNNKEWLEKVMLGLIFTESKGDSNAGNTSTNFAVGLTQLEKGAINDAKERASIQGNVDAFDPKTNITLAVYYLDKLFELYEDPTLVLWAYNLGIGNLNSAIIAFAKEKANKDSLELDEIQRIYNEPYSPAKNQGISRLVKDYKMNAVNLSTSDAVRKGFRIQKYPILDTTYEYVPRIAAATQLLNAV